MLHVPGGALGVTRGQGRGGVILVLAGKRRGVRSDEEKEYCTGKSDGVCLFFVKGRARLRLGSGSSM